MKTIQQLFALLFLFISPIILGQDVKLGKAYSGTIHLEGGKKISDCRITGEIKFVESATQAGKFQVVDASKVAALTLQVNGKYLRFDKISAKHMRKDQATNAWCVQLTEGPVNLYRGWVGKDEHYFALKEGEKTGSFLGINSESKAIGQSDQKVFARVVGQYFNSYQKLGSDIRGGKYTISDLPKITQRYNEWVKNN